MSVNGLAFVYTTGILKTLLHDVALALIRGWQCTFP